MAIRGDVSVDFDQSPRVISIAAPSVTIEIQDLVDTLRFLEAEQTNLTYPSLLNASGKDNLGSGYTGITATLQNAVLSFEARPGPATAQCSVTGGNLVAVNAAGGSINPIQPTEFTQVIIFQSTSPTLVIANGASGPLTDQDKTDIAVKVWQQPTSTNYGIGSLGEYVKSKLLTVAKFLALK